MIHTVGPIWNGGRNREEELLANCYFNSMKLARDNGIRSIAFPSISTGAYSFPVVLAAKIAVRTVARFCMRIRTASIWWNGCCLILRLNRCTKQKLRSIIIYEFSLFESKQKAQKGEIIHGFIGCRCTEWYRG